MSKLKKYITSSELGEPKKKFEETFSFMTAMNSFFFASSSKDALSLDKDERRFMIIEDK